MFLLNRQANLPISLSPNDCADNLLTSVYTTLNVYLWSWWHGSLVVEGRTELNRGRIACHAKQKQNQQAWLAIHHHGPWTALTGLEQTVRNYLCTYYNTPNSFAHCWCSMIKYSTLQIWKVSLGRYVPHIS